MSSLFTLRYSYHDEGSVMDRKAMEVFSLGECRYDSPVETNQFIEDGDKIVVDVRASSLGNISEAAVFENAGPRRKIFFNPSETTAAIVSCGGLCPGINNVIQSIVRMLTFQYRIKEVIGIRYGYEGLIPEFGHEFVKLTPQVVHDIHEKGGTILGSSRGNQDIGRMVDTLVKNNISILFAIGGDGTLRGANAIFEEINRRGLKISVVGVPKTIDNDIVYVYRTFGFSTAVSYAVSALQGAHAEATGANNGIGLVKVMGRDSGFIASYSALASSQVNYCLIPESPFLLHGPGGMLEHLKRRLEKSKHALILVAEGAGQEYCAKGNEKDASGNVKYGDIGTFLRDEITRHFKEIKFPMTIKYIDPSYIIRSMPASAEDAVFCIMLAQNAVHGAMAGKSGILTGFWNSYFTFLPISAVVGKRKKVEKNGYLWSMVKESTGQPDFQ